MLFSTSIVTSAISLNAFPTPPITAVDAPNASTRALDAASADSNSFRLPVINIGSRQNGRLQPKNVTNVDYNRKNILNKIKFCLNNRKFINSLKKLQNPYGDGNSAYKIIKVLKEINLLETTQKRNSY